VTDAREHAASSHAHYIGQRVDRTITPHPAYWALGNTPFAREATYAERVRAGLPAALQGEIDAAVQRGWALGDDAFLSELQSQTPRRLRPATPGRPRKPV
jgi:putative transposase